MKRIKKAHITGFLIGLVFSVIISALLDWQSHKVAWVKGVENGYEAATK